MSYMQEDAATDLYLEIAGSDLASKDPDELEAWATVIVKAARAVRDDYDENGYYTGGDDA